MNIYGKLISKLAAGLIIGFMGVSAHAALFDGGIPAGWSCNGNCGTSGADGVVGLSTGTQYGWISTWNGNSNSGLGLGSETNGSVLKSSLFSANAGDTLKFSFNYVTSDGAGYADYAWAKLFDSNANLVATLFTARTTPNGNTVPGFGMPPPSVVTTPGLVTVVGGAPAWSPLGGDTMRCYNTGCGYTGWVQSAFEIATSGNFTLEFGVVNWSDTAYASGMAIDGLTVNDIPVFDVPEPSMFAVFGLTLLSLALSRKQRR